MERCNVPVALIFFNRPQTLKKVFDAVAQVQPKQLFFIQDGPREGHEEDAVNIVSCRKIVEDITWDCEIYRNYSEINLGCGERPRSGITWVFEQVDRAIILEDDCVPELSFFRFCEILLEKYEMDTRVGMISGLNHFVQWNTGGSSYFFSKAGANSGWATWKRVWVTYDFQLKLLKNQHVIRLLKGSFLTKRIERAIVKRFLHTRKRIEHKEKISYWDIQLEANKYLYHWLAIIPQKNMICNIGTGDGATHNKAESPFNHLPVYHQEHLIHPKYLMQDVLYDRKYYRIIYPAISKRIYLKLRSLK
ncbi:MAG: HlpA protein [Herbinix sp.]|nr:HlpA protein [Herbinix sp.]